MKYITEHLVDCDGPQFEEHWITRLQYQAVVCGDVSMYGRASDSNGQDKIQR
jgi:hypothetical protein